MRTGRIAFCVYSTIISGGAIAVVGVVGMLAHLPLLFPSLGPTIFLQAITPRARSARSWNTIVGHSIGIFAAFIALYLCEVQPAAGVVNLSDLTVAKAAATAFAVGVTIWLQLIVDAQHPPATATTMLITLGGLQPDLRTVIAIAISIILITALSAAAYASRSYSGNRRS